MKILAFDSSNQALSIALLEDESLLGQMTFNLKKNHSITLMTSIDFLMSQAGVQAKELDRIALAQGPGSYTGLRLASSVAKTMAYSLNKELVGISSLFAIASRQKDKEKYIVPIMDARRGNAYSSVYQNNQEVVAEAHLDFAEFLKEEIFHDHKEKFVFTGQVENFKDIIISQGFTEEQIVSDGLDQLPSAYELGKKAINMEPVEVHSFAPNYLKKVEAEEKWLEKNEGKDKSADDYVKRI